MGKTVPEYGSMYPFAGCTLIQMLAPWGGGCQLSMLVDSRGLAFLVIQSCHRPLATFVDWQLERGQAVCKGNN